MRWASLAFGVLSTAYAIMAGDALLPNWHRNDVFVGVCCSMLIPSLLAIGFGALAIMRCPRSLHLMPAYSGVSLAILTLIRLVYWIRVW